MYEARARSTQQLYVLAWPSSKEAPASWALFPGLSVTSSGLRSWFPAICQFHTELHPIFYHRVRWKHTKFKRYTSSFLSSVPESTLRCEPSQTTHYSNIWEHQALQGVYYLYLFHTYTTGIRNFILSITLGKHLPWIPPDFDWLTCSSRAAHYEDAQHSCTWNFLPSSALG